LADKPVADSSSLPSIPTENGTPMPHQDLPKGSPIVEEIIQGMQTMREVIGELKNNASLPGQSKQSLATGVGAQDTDSLQDDQDQPTQTDDLDADLPKAPRVPRSATDVKVMAAPTPASTDINTGNLLAADSPMDDDVRSDDTFLQGIRKHVMDERAKRLHLRQQLSKLAIADQDLQRRIVESQENAADVQRQLRAMRLKGRKLREQLDQSRKTASKREIQIRKQLDAQNQKVKEQGQKLDDLRAQAQAALTNLTSQLQAATDIDRDDKKELKERDATIAKLQVGFQRVKAASDAALHSADEKAHKKSRESEDRIKFLSVQIQNLRMAMKKQAKALAAELTREKQKAAFLQKQMGALTNQEHTQVSNLKAQFSKSHDHEEQAKDEMMTRIADLQASLQKLQEAKASQDRDLGAKSHEIEQMKAVMRTEATAMKSQKVRIRRLFQESRKEEKKEKRLILSELKTAKSKVNSLEVTMNSMQSNAKNMLANLSGALNASHQQELQLATERSELRRELRNNQSRLQAVVSEVAVLKKRLAQEEAARKKADAAAHKAHNEFVQAKAVANQLQGTVPQLLEQVQLAHEKRDAEKAMRLQAQAMASNDIVRTNNAAEKQMQKQVEQIDKVLPLMNSAATQASQPAVESQPAAEDDATAGDDIDKAMDVSTEAATPSASGEGAEDAVSNTDASKPLASAGGATTDGSSSVVAELPDLDKDGESLAALIQN